MSNVFTLSQYKIYYMKVQPVKINNILPKAAPQKPLKKPTPIKDALIVSGYCSLPIVFYEAACFISKKVNKKFSDSFENQ